MLQRYYSGTPYACDIPPMNIGVRYSDAFSAPGLTATSRVIAIGIASQKIAPASFRPVSRPWASQWNVKRRGGGRRAQVGRPLRGSFAAVLTGT